MSNLEIMEGRRSINFFEPGIKIPEETLIKLVDLANLTPSSLNLQPWELIIVQSEKNKKILRECAFGQPKVEDASAVFIVVANPNAPEENIDRVLDNWVDLGNMTKDQVETTKQMCFNLYTTDPKSETRKIFAVKNASFFAMSIMLAARFLGLETHPIDGFNAEEIKKNFSIPGDRLIPVVISVGYLKKDVKLNPRAFRRSMNEFCIFV